MSIEQEIYNKLVEQFSIGEICIKKRGKRPQMTWLSFIKAALKLEPTELYGFCGFSRDSFNKYFVREYPSISYSKKSTTKWYVFLLSIVGYKYCSNCGEEKLVSEFSYRSISSLELSNSCKVCNAEYYQNNKYRILYREKLYRLANPHIFRLKEATRKANKLKATPKWADLIAIKEVYKNCPIGYHVDHEIPLQGELVCGLHVHNNLKPIPATENLSKSNKYTIV